MAFQLPFIYDYITKLRTQEALSSKKIVKRQVFREIGKLENRHRKCRRLELSGGQARDFTSG
jgi:hypothetical protein